jgi:alpha-L-rhamnosidase
MKASLDTRYGTVRSEWKKQDAGWRYEITTPVDAEIVIAGKQYNVKKGNYYFYQN